MQEHDDGPSDPAKVSTTISAALASGLITLPGKPFASWGALTPDPIAITATIGADGTATFPLPSPKPQPVTHATRPEVEILLAGRKDLMAEVDRWTTLLADREIASPDCDEVASLLGRLGAYIVGQDTRLIAAGEALAEERARSSKLVERINDADAATTEAQAERHAAIVDRDKADAAHGCAVRDYRAQLGEEVDARRRTVASLAWVHEEFAAGRVSSAYWGTSLGEVAEIIVRDLRVEIDQHKSDVRMAERAYDTELRKRQEAETRCAALEMRIEGAIFALRHGMNEGVEASAAMFSPSTSLVDYLAAPLDGTKAKIPGRGLYNDETIVVGVDDLRESIRLLGPLSKDDREDKLSAAVERLFMSAGLLPERHYKPRFRVVTSPRFYSDADRERAADAFEQDRDGFWIPNADRYRLVDILATALGMQRAAS